MIIHDLITQGWIISKWQTAIMAKTNTQGNVLSSITAVKFTSSFSTVENSGKTLVALERLDLPERFFPVIVLKTKQKAPNY